MGVSLRMIPVPDEDEFQKWKKQQSQPSDDDADFQAWKAKQQPSRDIHEEYRKGLLGPRMQRENTNEREASDAQPSYAERFATHLLNTAQGIPGMERVEAFAGQLGSHATKQPLDYHQSLEALRGNTEQIPTALRIGEHIVGGLPVAAALPVGQSKTVWQAAKSGAKVGAGLGASDAALSADEMPLSERAGRTVAGGIVGGAVGGAIGVGAKAVDKGRDLVRTYQRVKDAPTLGNASLAMDQKISDATRWNYGAADLEGEWNGGTSPAIQKAFENPRIKKYVDLVRDGEEGSPTSDADVAREAYKLMSKARRGHQRFMDINGYDADRDREVTKLGLAMKRLKDATATGSEKPPLTLDVAGETTETQPRITAGRETQQGPPMAGTLSEYTTPPSDPTLRQALRDFPSPAIPPRAQGPAGPAFQLRGRPDQVKPGVSIQTPSMRVQTAPAEPVPPVMPSFPHAVAEKARMEGERTAFNEASDAAKRIMAGTSVPGKKLLSKSPEAYTKAISEMTPEEAQQALAGMLGRAKEGMTLSQSGPSRTAWGAIAALGKPVSRLNRLAPFIDQLDQAAGKMPRRPANIDALLRLLGIANAPIANP